jgi:C1A family cysteine protease
LTCQNSWGAAWGDKGFFYLPYAYANNSELIMSQCCILQV